MAGKDREHPKPVKAEPDIADWRIVLHDRREESLLAAERVHRSDERVTFTRDGKVIFHAEPGVVAYVMRRDKPEPEDASGVHWKGTGDPS